MFTEINNTKNCKNCNKSNVCKYQEKAIQEIDNLTNTLTKMELPLAINVNCREWAERQLKTINIRRQPVY